MRRIETIITNHLICETRCKVGNTELAISEDGTEAIVKLHNNPIIRYKYIEGRFTPTQFNLAGWPSSVTKRRINNLVNRVRVFTKAGELYMMDVRFPSEKFSIPSSGWIDVSQQYDQLSLF